MVERNAVNVDVTGSKPVYPANEHIEYFKLFSKSYLRFVNYEFDRIVSDIIINDKRKAEESKVKYPRFENLKIDWQAIDWSGNNAKIDNAKIGNVLRIRFPKDCSIPKKTIWNFLNFHALLVSRLFRERKRHD
jgi:hypothetical protein